MAYSMISTIQWLPKGSCTALPYRYELADEELQILANASNDLTLKGVEKRTIPVDGDEDEAQATGATESTMEIPAELDSEEKLLKDLGMDSYDSDEEKHDEQKAELWLGGKNLAVYDDNKEDPYITLQSDDESDSDVEDKVIKPTDNILLVGMTDEDESSAVEMYIYDALEGDLYVHHDFTLGSFPLCMQWLSTNPQPRTDNSTPNGNSFVAVGTFQNEIDIWNLDVLDVLEPVATLGGYETEPVKSTETSSLPRHKRRNKVKRKLKRGSHADAVICLSWHPSYPSTLASGSADKTIKLWDVTTQQCTQTFNIHEDKVQCLRHNPAEPTILLSASYDRTVAMTDVRLPDKSIRCGIGSDPESLTWSYHQPFLFFISCENGEVLAMDARKFSSATSGNASPVFTLAAHDKAATAITVNRFVPSLFATSSLDKTVKIWDYGSGLEPTLVSSKNLGVGKLYTTTFDVDDDTPFLLASGGDKGKLAIWDISEDAEVQGRYSSYLKRTTHGKISNRESKPVGETAENDTEKALHDDDSSDNMSNSASDLDTDQLMSA